METQTERAEGRDRDADEGKNAVEEADGQSVAAKWEQALAEYGDTVYRLALVRTGHKQDAEDVTQDVFILFAQKLRDGGSFQSSEHEKAWLLRVTINQSKNLLNSAWVRRRASLREEIPVLPRDCSEVYYAVQALPEKYRTVIHLFYYEGYQVREIGSLLGKRENTVKSLLKRGRERLRQLLCET